MTQPKTISTVLVTTMIILQLQCRTTFGFPLTPIVDDISQELEFIDVNDVSEDAKEYVFKGQTHMPYPYYQYLLAQSQLAQAQAQAAQQIHLTDTQIPQEEEEEQAPKPPSAEPQPPKFDDPSKVHLDSILDEYDYEDAFLEDLEMVESNWKVKDHDDKQAETGEN